MKCNDVQEEDTNRQSCKGCREVGQYCSFQAPVRKRFAQLQDLLKARLIP